MAVEHVFSHQVMHLQHSEKFDFFTMSLVGIVNDFDHLSAAHPGSCMKA